MDRKDAVVALTCILIGILSWGLAGIGRDWLNTQKYTSYVEEREFQHDTKPPSFDSLKGRYILKYYFHYGKKIPIVGDMDSLTLNTDHTLQRKIGQRRFNGLYTYSENEFNILFDGGGKFKHAVPKMGYDGKIYLFYENCLVFEKE